jgi:hypothetical protein
MAMTTEGDIVLVHMDNNPAFFARIESITPDVKPGWFHVKLLVLQVPLLTITWILREGYYNGEEFTMGGHPMRMEKVVAPPEAGAGPEETESTEEGPSLEIVPPAKKDAKVVSLFDRRKKEDGH